MSTVDTYNSLVRKEFNMASEDDDKVLFALGVILDRAESRGELAERICNAYRTGVLGVTLAELIDIELIDDASQTVIQEMSR